MPEGPIPVPADRLDELVAMTNRVFRADGGDMGREYPLVFDPGALDGMRVMLEEGRVVSHVGVCVRDAVLLGAPLTVASIGAVSTDPAFRGRGFAGALMEDAIAYARARGACLMLISGDRALYRRLGGVRPGGFFMGEVPHADFPRGYAFERATPDDTPQLAALYQREPVRFVRPAEDWRRLLAAGVVMNQAADCLMVRDPDGVVAYLAVQAPPSHSTGETRPRVMEYAGSREAVWRALAAVAGEYGAASARFAVMPDDGDLLARARHERALLHEEGFHGTVKLLDGARLLSAVRPLWAERVGHGALDALGLEADMGGVTFTAAGDRVRLEGPAVITALFGAERGREEDQLSIPGISPLPLFWYGYNYV